MAENYKVSCEINISKHIRNDSEEKVVVDMKLFTCKICSKSFNRKDNMQRHINEVHLGKHRDRDVKHHEKGTYINENKYGEQKIAFKMKVNENYKNIKRGVKEVLHIEIMDNEIETVILK